MSSKIGVCFKNWYFFLVVTLLFGTAGPLLAQDTEDEFTLDEIVVTAEKREAEIQKVPLDISVVRTEEMDRLGIYEVTDLDKLLPDLNINQNAGSYVQINLRNVENLIWNPTFETTVAMHLNGFQLTRVNGLENNFYDLERVEVLKGPQGTLYGRGSTAGSMNIITKKPILGEFGGNIELEAGNYSLYKGTFALNIPIAEKLAIRLAGRRLKRDGYNDAGYSDANSRAGRFSLLWEPTDKTTLNLVVDNAAQEDNGAGVWESAYLTTYGGIDIVANPYNPEGENQTGGSVDLRYKTKWYMGDSLDDNWNDIDQYGVSATLDHELDWATLTVMYGHRSLKEDKDWVFGYAYITPYPSYMSPYPATSAYVGTLSLGTYVMADIRGHFDSLEARLTSKSTIAAGDAFEWIVGAMTQEDKVKEVAGPFVVYSSDITTKSTGLFGQASYAPFEKWNLTGGLRYSWDEKDYTGAEFESQETIDPEEFNSYSYSWSEPSYKLNLSYTPNNDIMTYLQYAKGYKTGNVANSGLSIEPEFLDAYELGFKSRWFDNRLLFNATVYYYEYDNYNQWANAWRCTEEDPENPHYCVDVASDPDGDYGGGPDYVVDQWDYDYFVNVGVAPGGSSQRGISASIMWLLTASDTVTATATWSKNEYDDYDIASAILAIYPDADNPYTDASIQNRDGQEFGGRPFRANVSYSHTWYIGTDMLLLTSNLFYNGKGIDQWLRWATDDQYSMPGEDDYWTGDVALTYTSDRWVPEGIQWRVRLWCNNVWDEKALSSISYSDTDFSGLYAFEVGSGTISGQYITPRTYGITFGVEF